MQNLSCRKEVSTCIVNFEYSDFELENDGGISLILSENQSYCSEITLKIQTTSSIPNETSSISASIVSDSGKFFRGYIPTTFKILMIPSLFKTDASEWKSDEMGYHISLLEDPNEGSNVVFSE